MCTSSSCRICRKSADMVSGSSLALASLKRANIPRQRLWSAISRSSACMCGALPRLRLLIPLIPVDGDQHIEQGERGVLELVDGGGEGGVGRRAGLRRGGPLGAG